MRISTPDRKADAAASGRLVTPAHHATPEQKALQGALDDLNITREPESDLICRQMTAA
jgi:hypothetical protein